MSDKALRNLAVGALMFVALGAAIISYSHIRSMALSHGETTLDSTLLPLIVDGTVISSSLLMLRASRAGLGIPWLARAMLVASVALTVAVNVAFGWSFAAWGVLLAGWPAAAFLGNAEATIGFGHKAKVSGNVSLNIPGQPSFSNAHSAAKIAYERSVSGGNPFTAHALSTNFGISRQDAKEIVQSVAVAANGHKPTLTAGSVN
jgi:Protein of unknown function (DUF2637)